jgi:hypothetical protein
LGSSVLTTSLVFSVRIVHLHVMKEGRAG